METYRDLISGMHDTYLSSVNNRMNEVMKILTILATIFIPLTFITGIYGMNFRHMPELYWEWGYYAALGLMLVIAVAKNILPRCQKNYYPHIRSTDGVRQKVIKVIKLIRSHGTAFCYQIVL